MDWDAFNDKISSLGDNIGRGLKGLFRARNERVVRKLVPLVNEVNGLETWAKGLDATGFKDQTAAFKQQIADGAATLDAILPRAFALVREASVRTLGLRHFDVQ